jgi:hypothetical protein
MNIRRTRFLKINPKKKASKIQTNLDNEPKAVQEAEEDQKLIKEQIIEKRPHNNNMMRINLRQKEDPICLKKKIKSKPTCGSWII